MTRAGLCVDIDSGALEFSGLHLAGDCAVPDEFVKFGLFRLQIFGHLLGQTRRVGRADRLMRFLRVLGFRGVFARNLRHETIAIFLADHTAHAGHRLRRHVDAVGSHIGNETGGLAANVHALIKTLRNAHGDGGRQSQLARGLLLQGRCGEGRVRMAPGGLGLNRAH